MMLHARTPALPYAKASHTCMLYSLYVLSRLRVLRSEQYKGVIEDLKVQEVSQDQRLKELSLFAEQEVVGLIICLRY